MKKKHLKQTKNKLVTLDLEDLAKAQEHDEGGLVQVYIVVINMKVEHKSNVVQIELYLNSFQPCTLLVDSRAMYNMILADFARILERKRRKNNANIYIYNF